MSAKNPTFHDAVAYMVRLLVRTAFGMSANAVIAADQAAPRGADSRDYATVKLMTSNTPDFDQSVAYANDTTPGSTDVVESIYAEYVMAFSIQFFRHPLPAADGIGMASTGVGAFDRAARLSTVLLLSSNMMLMEKMGLTFRASSVPRNLSTVINGVTQEDRGSVDITFAVANVEAAKVMSFASAEIQLTVDNQGHLDQSTIEV